MKINLEILRVAKIEANDDTEKISDLNEKSIVADMMLRRRLTRNSRISLYLADKLNAFSLPIIIGNSYGEVAETYDILRAIKNRQTVSPTAFQNSVHNTPASYISIVGENKGYIATISDSSDTSLAALRLAAIKSFSYDEILIIITDAINFDQLSEINKCNITKKECGVGLVIRQTTKEPTINITMDKIEGYSPSMSDILSLLNQFASGNSVIEIDF